MNHECSLCGNRSLICTFGNNQGLWRIHCPNGHVMTATPGYEISVHVPTSKPVDEAWDDTSTKGLDR